MFAGSLNFPQGAHEWTTEVLEVVVNAMLLEGCLCSPIFMFLYLEHLLHYISQLPYRQMRPCDYFQPMEWDQKCNAVPLGQGS